MQNFPILASSFGGWEIVLILGLILVLLGAKRLRKLARGLSLGVREFRNSFGDVSDALDKEAHDAGESLGGICGKPAADALTPDNKTAELYDPAAFGGTPGSGWSARIVRALRRVWLLVEEALKRFR